MKTFASPNLATCDCLEQKQNENTRALVKAEKDALKSWQLWKQHVKWKDCRTYFTEIVQIPINSGSAFYTASLKIKTLTKNVKSVVKLGKCFDEFNRS